MVVHHQQTRLGFFSPYIAIYLYIREWEGNNSNVYLVNWEGSKRMSAELSHGSEDDVINTANTEV